MEKKGWLILEDGSVFEGSGLGAKAEVTAEFVFNTGMTGYYGMLSDPASAGLGVVATFPVIGSWGAPYEKNSKGLTGAAALICREVSECPHSGNDRQDIGDFMLSRGITGLSGIDTRQLTRHIRKSGGIKGKITFDKDFDKAAVILELKDFKNGEYIKAASADKTEKKQGTGKNITVLDFGSLKNIFDDLTELKHTITAYPAGTGAGIILADKPDGVIIGDGPGDPKACAEYLPEIKKLMESGVPVFGIGLGHQLMALAQGFDTVKLPQGHRGANYPVKETATGIMYITAQNHGYAVDVKSVRKDIADIAYVNIHDGSVEGLTYKDGRCMSLQYYPQTGKYVLRPNAMFLRFLSI